jgi:hypothetical protein
MDKTAFESNAKNSLKKFFVDELEDICPISFDKSLTAPDIRTDRTIKKWIFCYFKGLSRTSLSEYFLELFIMTRQDAEGAALAALSDSVFALLVDENQTDGAKRIPFYDTSSHPWSELTNMVVQNIIDMPSFDVPVDETKFKSLSVRIRWGTKI